MHLKKLATFVISFYLVIPPQLFAADPPPSTNAAVTEKKIIEEARERLKEKREKPEIEKPADTRPAREGREKTFFVKEIAIRGNESIDLEELDPFIIPFKGRELTLTEANELARRIEEVYRKEGYITALVYLPPQRIEDQTLRIEVLEGKVGKLYIEGNKWFSKGSVQRHWHLKEGDVLKYDRLFRSIRRMNENPDRGVKAILKAGEKTGETDVYLKVKDRFPGHAGFQYDNQGVRATGQRRYGFNVKYNNFIIPDSIVLSGIVFGSDFGAVYSQYLIPLNSYGTKLIAGFSHSQVSPKKEFESSDINGTAQTYTTGLRQALIETERFGAFGHVGMDFKDTRTKDTTGTRRRDRLRIIRSGIDFQNDDKRGTTSFGNTFSFGIKGLGASGAHNPLAGRVEADPNFIKYEGDIHRVLLLPYNTKINLRLGSQYSISKLTPQEQFYLGGATTVRGYPEGDFLSDKGFLLNVDYYIPSFFFPKEWRLPYMKQALRQQIQLVAFFDEGFGTFKGDIISGAKSRHLRSAGGGLRIQLARHLYLRFDLAHVLGQEPLTGTEHTRLHFTLQTEV